MPPISCEYNNHIYTSINQIEGYDLDGETKIILDGIKEKALILRKRPEQTKPKCERIIQLDSKQREALIDFKYIDEEGNNSKIVARFTNKI